MKKMGGEKAVVRAKLYWGNGRKISKMNHEWKMGQAEDF